jgi:hypothetical protein
VDRRACPHTFDGAQTAREILAAKPGQPLDEAARRELKPAVTAPGGQGDRADACTPRATTRSAALVPSRDAEDGHRLFASVPTAAAARRTSRYGTGETTMNSLRIAAFALIAAGVLALVYGGFSYTKETHQAKLGPIELSVQEKQSVNIPAWAGVAGILVGGVLLLYAGKRN